MADKEIWIPVSEVQNGVIASYGDFAVGRLSASSQYARMSFAVPADFISITEAKIIVIPRVTYSGADWDISAQYGEIGQTYAQHSEADAVTAYNVTNEQLFAVDVSGILTGIAVDDYVGIEMKLAHADHDVDVLGLFFKYLAPAAGGSGAVGGSGPGAVGAVVGAAGGICGGHGSGGLRPF